MDKKYKLAAAGVLIVGFLVVAVSYLRTTNIAVLNPKGPIALKERNLLLALALLSLVVVIPVFGLLFFFSWKYRESNTKAKYTPEADHSRLVETIWWVIPSILIGIVAVITWNSSHQLDPFKPLDSNTPPLTIQVVALDWKWLFIYPQQHIATINFIQFPDHTPLNFEITSDAPMNSFWIPQLGGQIYAMAGMTTQLHLMASSDGDFRGSSANISGRGFAGMVFTARASTPTAFKNWVNTVKQSATTLSPAVYNRLAQPTTNNQVAYYTAATANIFQSVIQKYVPAGDSMSDMGAP
jgi:cytochrome o ubiquinol oxidase subunit 2